MLPGGLHAESCPSSPRWRREAAGAARMGFPAAQALPPQRRSWALPAAAAMGLLGLLGVVTWSASVGSPLSSAKWSERDAAIQKYRPQEWAKRGERSHWSSPTYGAAKAHHAAHPFKPVAGLTAAENLELQQYKQKLSGDSEESVAVMPSHTFKPVAGLTAAENLELQQYKGELAGGPEDSAAGSGPAEGPAGMDLDSMNYVALKALATSKGAMATGSASTIRDRLALFLAGVPEPKKPTKTKKPTKSKASQGPTSAQLGKAFREARAHNATIKQSQTTTKTGKIGRASAIAEKASALEKAKAELARLEGLMAEPTDALVKPTVAKPSHNAKHTTAAPHQRASGASLNFKGVDAVESRGGGSLELRDTSTFRMETNSNIKEQKKAVPLVAAMEAKAVKAQKQFATIGDVGAAGKFKTYNEGQRFYMVPDKNSFEGNLFMVPKTTAGKVSLASLDAGYGGHPGGETWFTKGTITEENRFFRNMQCYHTTKNGRVTYGSVKSVGGPRNDIEYGSKASVASIQCNFGESTDIDWEDPHESEATFVSTDFGRITRELKHPEPTKPGGVAMCHPLMYGEASYGVSFSYWANYYTSMTAPVHVYMYEGKTFDMAVTNSDDLSLLKADTAPIFIPTSGDGSDSLIDGKSFFRYGGKVSLPRDDTSKEYPVYGAQRFWIRECFNRARSDGYEWIGFGDADEFVTVKPGHTIHEFLESVPSTKTAVSVHRFARKKGGPEHTGADAEHCANMGCLPTFETAWSKPEFGVLDNYQIDKDANFKYFVRSSVPYPGFIHQTSAAPAQTSVVGIKEGMMIRHANIVISAGLTYDKFEKLAPDMERVMSIDDHFK